MSVTGYPDGVPGGGPMKVGPSIADIITGLNAVAGIVAALYHRDQNGGLGQHVDLALFDSTVAALSHYVQIYLTSGVPPGRRGTQGNGGVPSQMFRCADGAIMLTAGNDAQYQKLCHAIGRPDMATDSRFEDGRTRIVHRDALSAELQAVFAQKPAREWLDALEAAGVPSGPINSFKEVFDDPQIRARGLEIKVRHPYDPDLSLVGSPIHFSHTPIEDYAPPPLLGEHTDAVLEDLGYDESARARLRKERII